MKKFQTIFIVVMSAIAIYGIYSSSNKDESRETPLLAYEYAKVFVKESLKSPSTASFPHYHGVSVLDSNLYLVESFVDSQNEFGSMVRVRYNCLIYLDGETSRLVSLEFDE